MQLVEVLIKLDNVFTAPVYMEKIFPLFWNGEAKIYWLKRGKEAYWKVGIRICTPPALMVEIRKVALRGSHSNPNNHWFDIRFMLCFTLMRRTVINQLNAFPNQSRLEGSWYWREWTVSKWKAASGDWRSEPISKKAIAR